MTKNYEVKLEDVGANGVVQRGVPDCPPNEKQVAICRQWLVIHGKKRKTIRNTRGSYSLKPVVERWADTYVTNGAFIYAAILEGYRAIQCSDDGPNAYFNISERKSNIEYLPS